MILTSEQRDAYHRDGYLVVEDLITPEETEALRERVREYTHGGRTTEGLYIQTEPRIERGELVVEHPGDGIRKIDNLVRQDDLFQNLGLRSRVVDVIADILGPDLKLFRNSLMLKPPSVGSPKGWHQDSPYWPIAPMDLCSCWLPFDDATPENGCMMVLPGGHKLGPLPHIHVTDDFVIGAESLDASGATLCPMKAGSGLFFHSLIPHYTAPNRSPNWRRAMVLSYMSAQSHYTGEGAAPDYLAVRGRSFPDCV